MNVAHIERRPHMGLKWKWWGTRVRDSQDRTTRVETLTNQVEVSNAAKVARASIARDRVERAAVQVLADHEAVAIVAANARRGGS